MCVKGLTSARFISEPLLKLTAVGKPVCSSFPVLQVACYGVRINRNKQERKSYLLWGGRATENYEVMPGWRDCRTVPNLSRLLLSVIHPSASVSLFFCLGHCYTLLGSRSSPTLVTSLALLLLSLNDPVSPSSVTVQQYSVHPKESLPLLFLGFCLPILILTLSLPLLLLPTPSFSIHILEDVYERETERVCICTIFRCR